MLYLYEIQVAAAAQARSRHPPSAARSASTAAMSSVLGSPAMSHSCVLQGRGLGRFVMQLLELLAARAGLARLLLTVFHANESAVRMYRKLGYVLDEDSPGVVDPSGDHGCAARCRAAALVSALAPERCHSGTDSAGFSPPMRCGHGACRCRYEIMTKWVRRPAAA